MNRHKKCINFSNFEFNLYLDCLFFLSEGKIIPEKNIAPVVSVVMASWNRENFLDRSIKSLIKQDFNDWELVFVDDGSTDNTFEFLKKMQDSYLNFKYLRHSHRGLALSRNAGILASAGRFITFLDTDDEYLPDHLSLRLKLIHELSPVDLIYGGVRIEGNPYVPDKNNPKELIHLSECVIGATIFGKKEIFWKLSGFRNLDYSEDSDFMERAKQYFSIKKIDAPTYIYHRDAENSITNTLENSV